MNSHEIYIYDEIGPDFYGLVGAKSFIAGLKSFEAEDGDELVIRINSPGGDVFEAKAIGEAISRWKGPTVAEIDALAASAATSVAMRADTVRMSASAMFMIHDPWTITAGNASELRRQADTLDQVQDTMVAEYMHKTGKEREDVLAMVEDTETWLTADEALVHGFVDEITRPMQIAARIRPGQFHNLPEGWKPEERKEHQKDVLSPELVKYRVAVARRKAGV